MDSVRQHIRSLPARQQPAWEDTRAVAAAARELSRRPQLVLAADVAVLRARLAEVAKGRAHVAQTGDCAEDPQDRSAQDVARKAAVADLVAGAMRLNGHKPVLRVGRIAGQYCKPRSRGVEDVDGHVMEVYRGHLVNRPEPTNRHRRPDPDNLAYCYASARAVLEHLGWRGSRDPRHAESRLWTSHEALLLDYELPLLRRRAAGGLLLSSTHWPWIGERTRQLDGAHVALLAAVVNPVACKVGPDMTVAEVLALCERLDPRREAGRLTLIARMGSGAVAERLPPLVRAVRDAGHPVIWLCDPMHGNTETTPDGLKTRFLESLIREVRGFQCAVRSAGGIAGGLHLETTPDDVTECAADRSEADRVGDKYTTLCDPRLNPRQAMLVASAWQG